MATIKLNFARLSVRDKIALTRSIVAQMGGDARFVSPRPPLQGVGQLASELEEAENTVQAARQDAKAKTTIRNNKEDDLSGAIAALVGYVTSVANGDEEFIEAAGMGVRATRTSAPPPQPSALTATAGDHDGTVDLSWDPVVEAKSYVIEASPDPPTATSWNHHGVSTKSTFTVPGLTSGARLWFRVAAVNPNGQSPWSDPATKTVP